MATEQEHAENLNNARQNSRQWSSVETAKNLAQVANPVEAVSLLSQASIFSDLPFVVAFGAAILKDALDLVVVGALPGVGTVLSILAGITIFFMLLLSGSGQQGRMVKGLIKKGLVLAGGTLVEAIGFGLNFFPIETATVFFIYLMVLSDRKKEADQRRGNQ